MILIEAVSLIPYLVRNSDLSSSVKGKISEAGLYDSVPNIPFTAISARCFVILLFWFDGCLLTAFKLWVFVGIFYK
jgi:hypothetical protein